MKLEDIVSHVQALNVGEMNIEEKEASELNTIGFLSVGLENLCKMQARSERDKFLEKQHCFNLLDQLIRYLINYY